MTCKPLLKHEFSAAPHPDRGVEQDYGVMNDLAAIVPVRGLLCLAVQTGTLTQRGCCCSSALASRDADWTKLWRLALRAIGGNDAAAVCNLHPAPYPACIGLSR